VRKENPLSRRGHADEVLRRALAFGREGAQGRDELPSPSDTRRARPRDSGVAIRFSRSHADHPTAVPAPMSECGGYDPQPSKIRRLPDHQGTYGRRSSSRPSTLGPSQPTITALRAQLINTAGESSRTMRSPDLGVRQVQRLSGAQNDRGSCRPLYSCLKCPPSPCPASMEAHGPGHRSTRRRRTADEQPRRRSTDHAPWLMPRGA
jgi:hypothetical protein